MSAYGTKLAEGFSQKLMLELYDTNLIDVICNRDYEGEINAVGSKLNILNFDRLSEKDYANIALVYDVLTENNSQLIIDQYKSFYWVEKTLARWLSYIKNPHATIVDQVVNERDRNIDLFGLGLYGDVGAGNRVGTDYDTGTVTVTTGTGAVVGVGTAFAADMVGKGFKADGHTQWYRISAVAGVNNMTIEDDLDDVASQYTGGAIAGGSDYVIEADSAVNITTANLLTQVAALKLKLDQAEDYGFSTVPDTNRWLIVPPEFENIVVNASGIALHVPDVYNELVKRGFIGTLQGFKVFKSNRLSGDNTDGYHVLAGHPAWMTFAEKVLDARMEEDLPGDFGTAYKDLFVYGAKVTDSRRHFASEGLFTFNV